MVPEGHVLGVGGGQATGGEVYEGVDDGGAQRMKEDLERG